MYMISLRYGDITELKIECIVNASNSSGLGCHSPGHPCIDNAIHKKAGKLLLEECKKLHGIPHGSAKITYAYSLPSKYIIHATGPKIGYDKNGTYINANYQDFDLLATTYKNVLEVGKLNNISEIAFCCLSTGVFGFDKKQSSKVAFNTVINWLKKNEHHYKKIVFNTFAEEDYKLYYNLLSKFKAST